MFCQVLISEVSALQCSRRRSRTIWIRRTIWPRLRPRIRAVRPIEWFRMTLPLEPHEVPSEELRELFRDQFVVTWDGQPFPSSPVLLSSENERRERRILRFSRVNVTVSDSTPARKSSNGVLSTRLFSDTSPSASTSMGFFV